MNEQYSPEDKEKIAHKVELKIVEPRGDKNFMVGFECKTTEECQAYNLATESVLKKVGLNPFHQVGASPYGKHKPGYHAWEIWEETKKENLETLLLEIEQMAQSSLNK